MPKLLGWLLAGSVLVLIAIGSKMGEVPDADFLLTVLGPAVEGMACLIVGVTLFKFLRRRKAIPFEFSMALLLFTLAAGSTAQVLLIWDGIHAAVQGAPVESNPALRLAGGVAWLALGALFARLLPGANNAPSKKSSEEWEEEHLDAPDSLIKKYAERTQQLLKQAISDPLTGLNNRRKIMEVLGQELDRATPLSPCAILMIDIDDFKKVNDTYGHLVGDHVLQEVAKRIEQVLRHEDSVGRYGGEEFLVVLPRTGASDALRVARRIVDNVGGAFISSEKGATTVTCSVGVTEALPGETEESAVSRADEGLYLSKDNGKNGVTFNPSPMSESRLIADRRRASPTQISERYIEIIDRDDSNLSENADFPQESKTAAS